MTYPHLENAPEDHLSPEFLEYLRTHNEVVAETDYWLVIENCKYHTPDKPHLTAFHKRDKQYFDEIEDLQRLFLQYDLLIKSPKRQSVKRFHIHLIKPTT